MSLSIEGLSTDLAAGSALLIACLVAAVAAVLRFRRTPTAYLIAPAMIGLALRAVLPQLIPFAFTSQALLLAAGLVCQATLAVGIALIPLSLRMLQVSDGKQPTTF